MKSFRFTLICFILLATPVSGQTPFSYFSTTGDTILYAPSGIGHERSSSNNFEYCMKWSIHVSRRNPINDSIELISNYFIETSSSNSPAELISPDTLQKYKLCQRGIWFDQDSLSDITTSVSHANDTIWGNYTIPLGPKIKTVQSDVVAEIYFKEGLVYRTDTFRTILPVESRNTLPADQLMLTVHGWRTPSGNKYLLFISRIETTYSKDGVYLNRRYNHEMRFID
jgi:hypothetical protein